MLRKCYHVPRTPKTPKTDRRRIEHLTPATETQQARNMAANHQPQVPAAVQPGDDDAVHDEDIPAHLPETPRRTNPPTPQNGEHETRIARLEELLVKKNKKHSRRARHSRSSSRSTARSTTSNRSGRHRSGSRSRSSAHRSSRRRRDSHHQRSSSRRSTRSRRRSSSRTRSRSSRRRSKRRSRSTSSRRSHRRSKSPRSSRSRSRSRHRRSTRSRSRSKRRHSSSPRRRTDNAIKAQYPEMGKGKGELLPVKGLPLEPYYNLPPDLKTKARARRSRRDLTFPEYMCGLLSMIAKCAPPESQINSAINHAAQVAQDAAGYTWSAVREWSQTALTHLEEGKDDWVNQTGLIARERTRLSWIKGKPPQEVKIPCHAHNTDKCNERATHFSEGKTWVHGCAVCVYASNDDVVAANATNHTVRTCRRKASVRYTYDDSRSDNRRRTNHSQQKKDYRQEPAKSKN